MDRAALPVVPEVGRGGAEVGSVVLLNIASIPIHIDGDKGGSAALGQDLLHLWPQWRADFAHCRPRRSRQADVGFGPDAGCGGVV